MTPLLLFLGGAGAIAAAAAAAAPAEPAPPRRRPPELPVVPVSALAANAPQARYELAFGDPSFVPSPPADLPPDSSAPVPAG